MTRRSKNYEAYWYCRFYKKRINVKNCYKCKSFEIKKYKEIRKKSKKLAKLERNRDKGRIKQGICENCGKYSERLDPHEVYGGSNRLRSIKEGLVIMICRDCHKNEIELEKLRKKYQMFYEKNYTREEFIKLMGKSYFENTKEIDEENEDGT